MKAIIIIVKNICFKAIVSDQMYAEVYSLIFIQ